MSFFCIPVPIPDRISLKKNNPPFAKMNFNITKHFASRNGKCHPKFLPKYPTNNNLLVRVRQVFEGKQAIFKLLPFFFFSTFDIEILFELWMILSELPPLTGKYLQHFSPPDLQQHKSQPSLGHLTITSFTLSVLSYTTPGFKFLKAFLSL